MISLGPADTEVFRRRGASLTWTQSANSRTISFPLRLSTALGIAELRQYQDRVPTLHRLVRSIHFSYLLHAYLNQVYWRVRMGRQEPGQLSDVRRPFGGGRFYVLLPHP